MPGGGRRDLRGRHALRGRHGRHHVQPFWSQTSRDEFSVSGEDCGGEPGRDGGDLLHLDPAEIAWTASEWRRGPDQADTEKPERRRAEFELLEGLKGLTRAFMLTRELLQ